ncbi:MAG: ABC transporter permease [Promethearchaeota archaeon]
MKQMILIKYILRRILLSIASILGVITIAFFFTRSLSGLARSIWGHLPEWATYEDYLAEIAYLGLDKPIFMQYLVFMRNIFIGNWGLSLAVAYKTPVWDVILAHLPRTLEIMFISMSIAIFLGLRLGKISAANYKKTKDTAIRIFTYLMVSIPGFVVLIFLMQLYVHTPFRIFPLYGYKTPGYPEPPTITHIRLIDTLISGKLYLFFDYLWHLIVPVSAVTIVQLVIIIQQTRGKMLEVLQQDYIYTAIAKGCKNKDILKKHALKNAATPAIMVSSMGFPIVLGGMIAIERVYNTQGLGAMFFIAVDYLDFPLIIACAYVFALVVVVFNLAADILVAMIDPRIKLK